MEKSRTLVLVATMRSPTIGSPDQTYLRARCAKLGRPRRATAPDFPACAASPKGDQTTYLGPRTTVWRHDDDGVPGVRASQGCGRSFFPGSPPNSEVATGELLELAAGISCMGRARAQRMVRRPPPAVRCLASPGRHRRAHAACDSSGAGFCVPPPGSGSCRCRGGRPPCGSRCSPGNRAGPRT